MKIKFLIILLTFLVSNLFSNQVNLSKEERTWLESHPTIILGSDEQWSPYIIKQKNGKITGFDKDILNLVNKYTGANFTLTSGKWKNILEKAKSKDIDGVSTSAVHIEREKYFNFSKSYFSAKKLLFVTNTNPSNIKSVDDLANKRLAYQEQNLFEKKLISQFKNIIPVPVKTRDGVLKKMILGEVDAAIGSYGLIALANKMDLPFIKVVDFIPNSKLELVFSIRKDYKEAISILDKGLDAITEVEKIEIKNRWFFEQSGIYDKQSAKKYKVDFTPLEKAYLKKHPILKVQNLSSFPPFNFNIYNKPEGYSIDYMKLMAKYMGVKLEFISNKTWKEYLDMIKEGTLDIIPHIAVTNEREKFISYTDFYHIEYTTGMAIDKNTNYKSMTDLKNKIIAVPNKTFLHSHIKKYFPKQDLILPSSTSKSLERVSLGEADAAIGSLPTLDYFTKRNWYSNIKIVHVDGLKRPTKTSLPMGVAKSNLVLKSILEKVNSSLPQSEISSLKEKWMKVSEFTQANLLTLKEEEYLKNKKIIRMCVLPNWLPFEQIDKEGNHKGIGADIMDLVSKKINTPIVLVRTREWSKSLQNLNERRCDILPVAMETKKRKETMNFTRPYLSEPFVIATKSNELFIKDIKDIGTRKIGIVKSYVFADVLKEVNPNINIVNVKSAKDGLELTQKGEIFGYVDILPAIAYNIQKYAFFDLKIAGKLEYDIKLSVASRNDEDILNSIMQKVLDTIDEDRKRSIIGKWIEIKVQQEFDYATFFSVVAVLVVILLLVLYKNRSINLINMKLKKTHKQLNEQQKMINKYVLIVNTDLEGIITHVNEAYCNSIGYSKEELLGNTHKIVRHPQTSSSYIKHMWKLLKVDEAWNGEIKNLTKAKQTKYFKLYIEPMYQDGKKIGYHSISEDITSKKVAEKLYQAQQSLLSIFDKGDSVLFKWQNNNTWNVEYVSASISKLTAYEQEEFQDGKINYFDCINKEDVHKVKNTIEKALKNNFDYIQHKPYRITTKYDEEKWVLDYTISQKDENGITHFLGYVSDITEHVMQQENIAQQSKMISLGEMIGNIAHQWRQPLTLISSIATGTKMHKELGILTDKSFEENMDMINENIQYLSKTIEDFRNFIKGDRKLVEFNLCENISSFLNLVNPTISNYHIEVIQDCQKDILLENYPNDMVQALINIFNNAKDALEDINEDERYFFITTRLINEKIVISLRDNAGGIPENFIKKVFEPYTTTKHKSRGTGLGLNITYNFIVKGMNGEISVQNRKYLHNNKEYKGAEFIITLPKYI